MQRYELVFLLDSLLTDDDRKKVISSIEEVLGDSVKEKDNIGLLSLKYKLGGVNTNDKAFFLSYLLETDSTKLNEIKKVFLYEKSIVRYYIYKMNKSEKFLKFEKTQEELEKVVQKISEDKKLNNKISFFSNDKNSDYISWKSLPIIKKYISRFGEIKPRNFTGNSVSTQKKLRKIIIRARELGVLEYVK